MFYGMINEGYVLDIIDLSTQATPDIKTFQVFIWDKGEERTLFVFRYPNGAISVRGKSETKSVDSLFVEDTTALSSFAELEQLSTIFEANRSFVNAARNFHNARRRMLGLRQQTTIS